MYFYALASVMLRVISIETMKKKSFLPSFYLLLISNCYLVMYSVINGDDELQFVQCVHYVEYVIE